MTPSENVLLYTKPMTGAICVQCILCIHGKNQVNLHLPINCSLILKQYKFILSYGKIPTIAQNILFSLKSNSGNFWLYLITFSSDFFQRQTFECLFESIYEQDEHVLSSHCTRKRQKYIGIPAWTVNSRACTHDNADKVLVTLLYLPARSELVYIQMYISIYTGPGSSTQPR